MGFSLRRCAGAALILALPGIAAAGIAAAGIAAAADLPLPGPAPVSTPTAPSGPGWLVTVGGEIRAVPAWPGAPANKFGVSAVPLLAVQKPGDPPAFFEARDGFGVAVLDVGPFQLGPVGKVNAPRYNWQYTQLNGLGEVPWALQLGGYTQYWMLPWLRLRGELRQGVGGETGASGDVFVDAVVPLAEWRISGGPRVSLQSAGAVSPYYSITAAQSAASSISGLPTLPVYNAAGGLYSYGAGGQMEYFWNRHWSTHAIFEYERLAGSVAESPLVTMRGSPNQLTLGVGATYTFAMHPLW